MDVIGFQLSDFYISAELFSRKTFPNLQSIALKMKLLDSTPACVCADMCRRVQTCVFVCRHVHVYVLTCGYRHVYV